MTWRGLMIAAMLVVLSFSASIAHAQTVSFDAWISDFKAEAIAKGFAPALVDNALRGVTPNETVVRLDRKQPEDKISFTQYKRGALNQTRLDRGRALMRTHKPLLTKISAKYQVPPQMIVALWGVETEFGANKGNFSLVQSLATLAYEGRRADFFRAELFNLLTMMQQDASLGPDLTGSWAGAMGHCQFMPSSYLKFAVDWDGDGHRDIWNSTPDALASIANYLQSEGWNGKLSWGTRVQLPSGTNVVRDDLYTAQPMTHWRMRGLRAHQGQALPSWPDTTPAYVMDAGEPGEGSYLVTDNYHVLLKWNRSRYFATVVGTLSDLLLL